MNLQANSEIHFHEQEVLSVFSECFCVGNEEKLAEVALGVFFALRNLGNLAGDQSASRLGQILIDAPNFVPQFATQKANGGFRLIDYPGHPGRKSFSCSLQMSENGVRFAMTPRGFGWLATGINFYAPIAVLGYLRSTAIKRSDDAPYQSVLAKAFQICGQLQLANRIGLSNQNELGCVALTPAFDEYI